MSFPVAHTPRTTAPGRRLVKSCMLRQREPSPRRRHAAFARPLLRRRCLRALARCRHTSRPSKSYKHAEHAERYHKPSTGPKAAGRRDGAFPTRPGAHTRMGLAGHRCSCPTAAAEWPLRCNPYGGRLPCCAAYGSGRRQPTPVSAALGQRTGPPLVLGPRPALQCLGDTRGGVPLLRAAMSEGGRATGPT